MARSADATEAHTQLGLAWLWHAMGCRVLAAEVGIGPEGDLVPASKAKFRADLMGVTPLGMLHMVEVKGHTWDATRDRSEKWALADKFPYHCWVLVPCTVLASSWAIQHPAWGVVQAKDEEASQCHILRFPTADRAKSVFQQGGAPFDHAWATNTLYYMAQRSCMDRLPKMNFSGDKGRSVQEKIQDSVRAMRSPNEVEMRRIQDRILPGGSGNGED